jgi:hypothetical protein
MTADKSDAFHTAGKYVLESVEILGALVAAAFALRVGAGSTEIASALSAEFDEALEQLMHGSQGAPTDADTANLNNLAEQAGKISTDPESTPADRKFAGLLKRVVDLLHSGTASH